MGSSESLHDLFFTKYNISFKLSNFFRCHWHSYAFHCISKTKTYRSTACVTFFAQSDLPNVLTKSDGWNLSGTPCACKNAVGQISRKSSWRKKEKQPTREGRKEIFFRVRANIEGQVYIYNRRASDRGMIRNVGLRLSPGRCRSIQFSREADDWNFLKESSFFRGERNFLITPRVIDIHSNAPAKETKNRETRWKSRWEVFLTIFALLQTVRLISLQRKL